MEIVIFTELTTNDHLDQLKAESEKYTGLYVDMNVAKERKYVKDKAADIKLLLGKVERLRIDATANYKVKVEAEAADIKERLEIANLPFTLLIDEYAAERKKILDAEKAEKLAVEIAVKLEADHEFALLMNDKYDNEKAAEKARLAQAKIDSDALIAKEAKEKAEQLAKQAIVDAQLAKQKAIDDKLLADKQLLESQTRQKLLEEQAAQAKLNNEWLAYISEAYDHNNKLDAQAEQKRQDALAEQRRIADIEAAKLAQIKAQEDENKAALAAQAKLEANKEHVSSVRGEIKTHLMATCDISEGLAVEVVKALLKIKNRVTINY